MNGTVTFPETRSQPRVRAGYDEIRLYAPDRRAARVDLSDNTNRWGMPPAARAALRGAADAAVVRYPSLYADDLKAALAEYAGVDAGNIVTGCGSDDVLDSAIRAFSEQGDVVAAPSPVFPMVPLFARMNGLSFAGLPMTADFGVDVDALAAVDPALVYLCSPNNPTSTSLPVSLVRDVIAATRAVIIVDEAYIEFGGVSAVELTRESPRLLVVRTMSKAFGLAGLRIGYAIGAPELVAAVEKSRGPYKVNALAERAGVAALTDGLPWVRERIADAREARSFLTAELERRGIVVFPSAANFVFCPFRQAEPVALMMRDAGVAVRPFTRLASGIPALVATEGAALRISVGPRGEINAMLAALDQARRACG